MNSNIRCDECANTTDVVSGLACRVLSDPGEPRRSGPGASTVRGSFPDAARIIDGRSSQAAGRPQGARSPQSGGGARGAVSFQDRILRRVPPVRRARQCQRSDAGRFHRGRVSGRGFAVHRRQRTCAFSDDLRHVQHRLSGQAGSLRAAAARLAGGERRADSAPARQLAAPTLFASRNSHIGFAGGWGTLLLGNWDTPWKWATLVTINPIPGASFPTTRPFSARPASA